MSVIERDEQRHRRRIACTCGLSRAPIDQGRHAEDCPLGIYDALTHQHAGAVKERDAYKVALENIEGSPRAGIGCDQQVIARAVLNLYREPSALPLPRTDQTKEDR